MLIEFSVSNWQSFRNKATLSMVASKERQHRNRLAKADKHNIYLLPIAAIYGANASGKTKFFNALEFSKNFVVKITQPESAIPREYFKLDNTCANKPSTFSFELLINDIFYEFSFSVTQREVTEEKLVEISSYSEKVLYYRKKGEKIIFPDNAKLEKDKRLQFVAEGTRENQLFLTASIDQKIKYFQPIYDWFKHNLVLITPTSVSAGFGQYIQKDDSKYSSMNTVLSKLDTGITRLTGVDIPFESIPMDEEGKTEILEDIAAGHEVLLRARSGGRIVVEKINGTISAKRLVSSHVSQEGNEILFELDEESAGTLRLIDFLPVFNDLVEQKNSITYVIDEIDRCLHTMMTRALLENYLNSCAPSTRSQLLFTTHDVFLMDQDLLRRDEIWIAERDAGGSTSLISLSDYKGIRYDKDIRKSYMKGSFGGIPKILLPFLKKQE